MGRGSEELAALVEQALAMRPEERSGFLDQACRDDPALRRQVEEALLDTSDAPTLLQDSEDFMPTGELPRAALDRAEDPYKLTGSTVAHYEVRRRLGRGGMGVVYKAFDTRLNREVALKFILLSMSAEPRARRRFFAEARAASALDHVNICTIHEIGETGDGQIYIAMAYYRGETLDRKIARGPLGLEEALDYGAQIASGLAAAHAKEILHRDMKPANVMVTEAAPAAERGVVKILDFGLAKVEDLQLTRTGTTLGTLAYTSPEAAEGGKVDHRADVWALGVMLYEMLAGRRPFRGPSDVAVLNALLHEEPEPLRKIDPEIPEVVEHLVMRCLEKDRERRYPGMEDLLADLKSLLMVSASRTFSGGLAALPGPRRPPSRRRLAAAAAGLILALLLVALLVPASRRVLLAPLAGPPPKAKLVAVLPFINTLEETAENRALADGLTHSLTGMVARLGTVEESLWLVPASEIVQQGIATAGDAQRLFGVDTVVTGSVQRMGQATEVVLTLVDPTMRPPRTLDSRTVSAPLSPALREEALDALAELLGVGAARRARLAVDIVAAASPAAYRLYLRGVGYLQRFQEVGSLEAAAQAFGEAVELDPQFGPAHAGLCEALWDKFRLTGEATLTERALESCDRASRLAEGQAPVLVSIGRIYHETGRDREAEGKLRRALELEPGNAEAHRWLGWALEQQGRSEEAEQAFRRAIELKPRLWIYYNDLGQVLSGKGRYEEAAEMAEENIRLTPENYMAYSALGVAREALNEVAEAERLYRRSAELQPNPLAYRNLGLLFFREEQYEDSVRELERARDLSVESPSFNDWVLWSWLANAYYWAGDKTEAEAAWRRLVEIATPLYEVNPKDVTVLMFLAEAHVALGELEPGRYYHNRLLALPSVPVHTDYYIGRIYEMMGDRELAVGYLAQAFEGRFDPLTIDRDPWLRELRDDSRYQVLRQQYVTSATG